MSPYSMVNTYLNNHYEGMTPEQLILLLYKEAIDRLRLTAKGIEENNIKKKGENLSKAIAIISELNASVDSKMDDESTLFLRGLYHSILMELPKVSLNNDTRVLKQTETYISKLKQIWETDVMANEKQKPAAAPPLAGNYTSNQSKSSAFRSIAV